MILTLKEGHGLDNKSGGNVAILGRWFAFKRVSQRKNEEN
jgi:hypothetical protein